MKIDEMQKLVLCGTPILVCEYRMGKAETVNYREKETGKSKSIDIVKHTVETGTQSIAVSEYLPDGTNPKDWSAPFKKGARVAVVLVSLISEKGNITARGVLHALEG